AENQGVASLETDDSLCSRGISDEQRVNLLLRDRFRTATLSHAAQYCRGRHDTQDLRRDQRVVQNHIRRAQDVPGFACQQIRIAQSRSNEIDLTPIILFGGILPRLELREGAFARKLLENRAPA